MSVANVRFEGSTKPCYWCIFFKQKFRWGTKQWGNAGMQQRPEGKHEFWRSQKWFITNKQEFWGQVTLESYQNCQQQRACKVRIGRGQKISSHCLNKSMNLLQGVSKVIARTCLSIFINKSEGYTRKKCFGNRGMQDIIFCVLREPTFS